MQRPLKLLLAAGGLVFVIAGFFLLGFLHHARVVETIETGMQETAQENGIALSLEPGSFRFPGSFFFNVRRVVFSEGPVSFDLRIVGTTEIHVGWWGALGFGDGKAKLLAWDGALSIDIEEDADAQRLDAEIDLDDFQLDWVRGSWRQYVEPTGEVSGKIALPIDLNVIDEGAPPVGQVEIKLRLDGSVQVPLAFGIAPPLTNIRLDATPILTESRDVILDGTTITSEQASVSINGRLSLLATGSGDLDIVVTPVEGLWRQYPELRQLADEYVRPDGTIQLRITQQAGRWRTSRR